MNGLLFSGIKKLTFTETPDPTIVEAGDVILKLELAGICGSDLHPYHGREEGLDLGTVMGHEGVGTIVEVGKSVRSLKKGDRVFVPFTSNCGGCFYCERGLTCRCSSGQLFGWVEKGRGLHGLQGEYSRIPFADSTLMKVPEGVKAEEALLLGDVFSTGRFSAEMAGVSEEGTFVVLGCGPVGLASILNAKVMGATSVFAVDTIAERLEKAVLFGATAIDFKKQNVKALVLEETDGRGADGVIEAVGSAAAERLGMDLVRPGGTLCVTGVHTDKAYSFSPVEAYNKNLIYKTGRCPARYYAEKLLPLVREKRWGIDRLITHRFPLKEGAFAYQVFDEKRDACIKAVLTT